MTFEDKIKFLRKLPKFMVVQEIEVKAVAFAAQTKPEPDDNDFVLGETNDGFLTLTPDDIAKIVREYPDLKPKLNQT